MGHTDNVIDIRRPVEFTVDGRGYHTTLRRQSAADLLLLAGVDPRFFDLGEVRPNRVRPVRYHSAEIVEVRKGTRFVSLSDRADVI